MLKTLSQGAATAAFTFGAFAVLLVVLVGGGLGLPTVSAIDAAPTFAAPLVLAPRPEAPAIPPADTPTDTVARVHSAAVGGVRREGARVAFKSAPPEKKTRKKRKCLAGNADIERIDGTTYTVDRDVLKYYRGHLGQLNALGHASTYKVDGKSEGFVVRGIRCGNDLHAAGIRNGDVIHAVNGKAVTNIPQAIAVYMTQGGKDVVTLSITRKGAKKEMTYHLG